MILMYAPYILFGIVYVHVLLLLFILPGKKVVCIMYDFVNASIYSQ